MPMQTMYTKFEEVSPQTAQQWMKRNVSNRPIRKSNIKRFVNLINTGDFKTTHQGIAFDTNKHLADGQHRLLAIIETGATVRLAVTREAPPEIFPYLDQAVPRNVSDQLSIPTRQAEVIRLAYTLASSSNSAAPPAEYQLVHDVIGDLVEGLLLHCASSTKVLSSAPVKLAAVVAVMLGEDKNTVFEAYRNLCLGNMELLNAAGKSMLKLLLRSKLTSESKNILIVHSMRVFANKALRTHGLTRDEEAIVPFIRTYLRETFDANRG